MPVINKSRQGMSHIAFAHSFSFCYLESRGSPLANLHFPPFLLCIIFLRASTNKSLLKATIKYMRLSREEKNLQN